MMLTNENGPEEKSSYLAYVPFTQILMVPLKNTKKTEEVKGGLEVFEDKEYYKTRILFDYKLIDYDIPSVKNQEVEMLIYLIDLDYDRKYLNYLLRSNDSSKGKTLTEIKPGENSLKDIIFALHKDNKNPEIANPRLPVVRANIIKQKNSSFQIRPMMTLNRNLQQHNLFDYYGYF